MAKRGSPALYELLGRNRDAAKAGGSGPAPLAQNAVPSKVPYKVPPREPARASIGGGIRLPAQRVPSEASAPSAGTPARTSWRPDPTVIRVLLGSALGLALLVGVYKLVPGRAEAGSASDSGSGNSATGTGTPNAAPADDARNAPSPTDGSSAAGNGAPAGGSPHEPSENPIVQAPVVPVRPPAPPANQPADPNLGPALGPTPAGVDPRQAGLNYWVLANVLEANAPAIVQYCRDRGLDAWAVPDQNGRLREITVLPGIPKSELNGATASALKTRVRKIGAQLKAAGRVNDGFEGAYFKLFKG